MLPTKRSAMALARGACNGVLMMRISVAVNTASNAAVNLASRSRMRNRNRLAVSSRSMARLRACWVSQAPVGWAVTPRTWTRPGGVLDDEERVQPVQGDGVEVEQVAGEDGVRLGPQQLGPRWSGSPRRGVDAGVVQDGPDGGGADLVAEPGELAMDPSISPGGVLGGQTNDQRANAGGDRRSTGPCGLGGPAAGDQLSVPAQDGGWRDQQPEALGVGSSRVSAAIRARSAQVSLGRLVCRRSTASW
jgi:hypothetical protein